MAACSQTQILTLPATLGSLEASFAVDTGAAVNVLSADAYRAIKRASRGSRWPLRPSDLNLVVVSSDSIGIKGIVRLPICLGKHIPVVRVDFYVASNFALPADGLLGLPTLKSMHMTITPDNNLVQVFGKHLKAMDQPVRLACSWTRNLKRSVITSAVPTNQPHFNLSAVSKKWRTVNAVVIGDHVIPPKTAAHIPLSVPQATFGCDICLEGPSHVAALAVESTLTTVQEGNRTIALVVNTMAGPLKLRKGVLLAQVLAFDGQVIPTPIQLPSVSVGAIHDSSASTEKSSTASLDSLVKVVDYPEHRPSLLSSLNKYRTVIALPGEPLGATSKAEHLIRLKSGAKPAYIPAYRLPHSQRQVVDEQIDDMLQQGVIQPSKSQGNSLLFLVPKKDGQF